MISRMRFRMNIGDETMRRKVVFADIIHGLIVDVGVDPQSIELSRGISDEGVPGIWLKYPVELKKEPAEQDEDIYAFIETLEELAFIDKVAHYLFEHPATNRGNRYSYRRLAYMVAVAVYGSIKTGRPIDPMWFSACAAARYFGSEAAEPKYIQRMIAELGIKLETTPT